MQTHLSLLCDSCRSLASSAPGSLSKSSVSLRCPSLHPNGTVTTIVSERADDADVDADFLVKFAFQPSSKFCSTTVHPVCRGGVVLPNLSGLEEEVEEEDGNQLDLHRTIKASVAEETGCRRSRITGAISFMTRLSSSASRLLFGQLNSHSVDSSRHPNFVTSTLNRQPRSWRRRSLRKPLGFMAPLAAQESVHLLGQHLFAWLISPESKRMSAPSTDHSFTFSSSASQPQSGQGVSVDQDLVPCLTADPTSWITTDQQANRGPSSVILDPIHAEDSASSTCTDALRSAPSDLEADVIDISMPSQPKRVESSVVVATVVVEEPHSQVDLGKPLIMGYLPSSSPSSSFTSTYPSLFTKHEMGSQPESANLISSTPTSEASA
ncbi:unnamed protein product [Protopolystoma xenopodis]|uniref:Uncharacterized protein n=1 Tax=Protopolystoma xenopodis TaxID=117903 RepID=A0A448XBG1_9PLAT|nr:unnamed protein product [Protopolystoma xenopodis]